MIIYICNEEQKNLLDNMAEKYEWELLKEVFAGESLSNYITEKLQVIQSLSYMVIDRASIKENDKDLNEVIETIQCMYGTQIILLTEEIVDDNGEQQKVIYGEHYTSLDKYQDNLERNIEYLLTGEKIPAEFVVDGIWIGIMSSGSGAGCTDFSIGLTNYIYRYHPSVCYVEANESGDLNAMSEFYGMEKTEDNHYVKDGIDYWHQSIDQSKKYVVMDLGKYSAAKLGLMAQCKIKVLITDGKPYRIADALNVYQHIGDADTKVFLNFCNDDDCEKLQVACSQFASVVGRIGWHKHLFEGEDPLYQLVMKNYINPEQNGSRKISFLLQGEKLKGLLKGKSKAKFIQDDEAVKVQSRQEEPEVTEPNPEENVSVELEQTEPEPEENELVEPEQSKPELEETEDIEPIVNQEIDFLQAQDEEFVEAVITQDDSIPRERKKTRKPVKLNILLLLIAVTAVYAVVTDVPVKETVNHFLFHNQESEPATTELVDEELNINPDIKISVLEVDGADGYEVSYSTDKAFPEERTVVVEVETADKAVESLVAGKTYYVRVRAFKFNEDGIKVYGEYTEVQEIET